jgi:hypothetical protein
MRTSTLARSTGDVVRHHHQDLVLILSRPNIRALLVLPARDAHLHRFIPADLPQSILCPKKICSPIAFLALSRQLLLRLDRLSFRDPDRQSLPGLDRPSLLDPDPQSHLRQMFARPYESANLHLPVSAKYPLVQPFVPLQQVPQDRMTVHKSEHPQQDLALLGLTPKLLVTLPFLLDHG